jgi:hypothetical protein
LDNSARILSRPCMYKGGREIVLNKLLGTSDLLNDSIQY